MKTQAVFFDLDGTLVDTAPDFYLVVNGLRQEAGLALLPEPKIREQVSNGGIHLACLTWGITPEHPEIMDYRQRLLDRYSQTLGHASGLFPGFNDVLRTLTKQRIPWGIVTNKPKLYAKPLLAQLKLDTELLICPEDVSQRKPHPEPLLKAAEFFQAKPQHCLYVGDHVRDIESAKAAQMPSAAALFGYIEPHINPLDWQAEYLLHQPQDLLTLLEL